MNFMINIIMAVTCYPILLVIYYLFKDAGDKNMYCFGATLKKELRCEQAVQEIKENYKKKLKRCIIILALIPVPVFFIQSFSIIITIWMLWILLFCFVPMVYVAQANKQIIELKQQRGWQEDAVVSYVDLKTATVPGRVKWTTFLPMLLLSTVPTVIAFIFLGGYGDELFGLIVATFSACTYLFYFCAVWTDKQKITIICLDSDINMNYTRAKKQLWKKYWVICAWINTIFTWFMLLVMWKQEIAFLAILWGSIFYCILIIGVTVWLLNKLHHVNGQYEDKKTLVDSLDDDKYWIWGIIYCNKNDKHYMVENRLGTGTGVNLGNKAGLITVIIGCVALLSIPIMCVWLFLVEFTPMRTHIHDDVMICEQLTVAYELPLKEIDSYEILTELPRLSKVNGIGMDNLCSGTFKVYEDGAYDKSVYEVFLNPQNTLFLKIKIGEQQYYISAKEDASTQKLLDRIKEIVKCNSGE